MTFEEYANNPNVRALLDAIAWGEGANYNTVFGGGSFSDYSRHPNRSVTAGGYTSTAAGRYQFLASTWANLQRNYGLADFMPHSQDLGAIALIAEKGALANIVAGDFDGAVKKIRGVWPSLPGGSQQTRTWEQSRNYYNAALAVYGGTPGAGASSSGTPAPLPILTYTGGDGSNLPVTVTAGGGDNKDDGGSGGLALAAVALAVIYFFF